MPNQKHLTRILRLSGYFLANQRLMVFVPLIAVYGFVATLCGYSALTNEIAEAFAHFLFFTRLIFPIFSVWWIMLSAREILEADGKEVLRMFFDSKLLWIIGCLFILFFVAVFPFYFVMRLAFAEALKEFLQLFMSCVFILGFAWILIFSTKSLVMTWMALILYDFAGFLVNTYTNAATFPFYFNLIPADFNIFGNFYIPLMIVGVMMFFIGEVLRKKKVKSM